MSVVKCPVRGHQYFILMPCTGSRGQLANDYMRSVTFNLSRYFEKAVNVILVFRRSLSDRLRK